MWGPLEGRASAYKVASLLMDWNRRRRHHHRVLERAVLRLKAFGLHSVFPSTVQSVEAVSHSTSTRTNCTENPIIIIARHGQLLFIYTVAEFVALHFHFIRKWQWRYHDDENDERRASDLFFVFNSNSLNIAEPKHGNALMNEGWKMNARTKKWMLKNESHFNGDVVWTTDQYKQFTTRDWLNYEMRQHVSSEYDKSVRFAKVSEFIQK